MTQILTSSMPSSWVTPFFAFLLVVTTCARGADDVNFDQNYNVTWGFDHVTNLGKEVQLSMDTSSGAGFRSKLDYGSGLFKMRMKIPKNNSPGVVTSFYLTSHVGDGPLGNHDELDFEFLGTNGMPTLQTNVFANDGGHREQRIHLWFDPTADFHTYQILWNQNQIVFLVDDIPIRVFKNNTKIGVNYPSNKMHIEGSIWNGESWASNGKKIDWTRAPFIAHYQGFVIDGCQFQNSNTHQCYSSQFEWNMHKYWELDPNQHKAYEHVRRKYIYYDYCSKSSNGHPECQAKFLLLLLHLLHLLLLLLLILFLLLLLINCLLLNPRLSKYICLKNWRLTPEQPRERDAEALQEKTAKKAAQAAGGGSNDNNGGKTNKK